MSRAVQPCRPAPLALAAKLRDERGHFAYLRSWRPRLNNGRPARRAGILDLDHPESDRSRET